MRLSIELVREDDGRWIAEVHELPGVLAYGPTREQAIAAVERLAVEVVADRIEHREFPASCFNLDGSLTAASRQHVSAIPSRARKQAFRAHSTAGLAATMAAAIASL